MKKASISKKQTKTSFIVTSSIIVLILAAAVLYVVVLKPKSTADVAVTETNKNNTAIIEGEKVKTPIVITPETKPTTPDTSDTQTQSSTGNASTSGPQATVDTYGPSTNLNRPNIHNAVIAVQSLYDDFISKIYGAPLSSQQAIADQFMADNSAIFSPDYNYLNNYSIHLIPQGAGMDIPSGMTAHSAIIDSNDPSQTIVQMYFDHDSSWSILLVVKMKDTTNIGTVQKLMPRMNINPL